MPRTALPHGRCWSLVRLLSATGPSLKVVAKSKPTRDDDVRLVADFVRRLRRVALHPLARDDQGELLRELMSIRASFTVRPEGLSSFKFKLVDEVMFESLALRLRPLTLNDDHVSFYSALKALDRLTDCRHDRALRVPDYCIVL